MRSVWPLTVQWHLLLLGGEKITSQLPLGILRTTLMLQAMQPELLEKILHKLHTAGFRHESPNSMSN